MNLIAPIPTRASGLNRIVAPVSTVVFVPRSHQAGSPSSIPSLPTQSNLSKDKHWTDCFPPGSIAIFQQPSEQIVALLGDIVATRLKVRGVVGAVIDGRARDIVSCANLCKDGKFQVWSRALSSVGTSLEAKPWAVNVPLTIGGVEVKPGDILCADEGEQVMTVIPREKLKDVMALLPNFKAADDAILRDVQQGDDLAKSFKAHPDHYTNQ